MIEAKETININDFKNTNYISEIDEYLTSNNLFINNAQINIICNSDIGQKIFPDSNVEVVKLADSSLPFANLDAIINNHKYHVFMSTDNSFENDKIWIVP